MAFYTLVEIMSHYSENYYVTQQQQKLTKHNKMYDKATECTLALVRTYIERNIALSTAFEQYFKSLF